MQYILSIIILCVISSAAAAQRVERDRQAGEIKAAFANGLIKPKKAVKMVLRNLSTWDGVVLTSGDESFNLKIKRPRGGHSEWTIPYKDILEIGSANFRITFAPNVSMRPHGGWDELLRSNKTSI